jgi:hypothetical protein
MKKTFALFVLGLSVLGFRVNAQTCDDFNRANSTTISGWTEQVGDWNILSNTLAAPASAQWNYITFDGSTQTDGCMTAKALYTGSAGTKFIGLTSRFTSTSSNLMVKLQDNNSAGYWDSYFIYEGGTNIISSISSGMNYGTSPTIQLEYVGTAVTFRIDTDDNGTWDYVYTATTSVTSAGLCGVAAYDYCFLDDFCYSSNCSLISNCQDFNAANNTIVSNWTEQIGDWSIFNNSLLAPSGGWNYITLNGSTYADGCITARAMYSGVPGTKFMGLTGRYSSPTVNITVKVQDNSSVGYWDSYWIYSDDGSVSSGSGLNFGTDANIRMEYTGSLVTFSIDTDRNGTWDYVYTGTVGNTSAGLSGVAAYEVCSLDDWCYNASCCTPPDPAGSISGTSTVCEGVGGVSYSVPLINLATTYVWSYTGTGVTINGTGNTVTLDFAVGATSGNLSVKGHSSCGDGTVSADFPIVVDPCTGIQDASGETMLRVVPDPSIGVFSVILDAKTAFNGQLIIYDMIGTVVFEKSLAVNMGNNRIELDLAAHPAGVYYLSLNGGSSRLMKTIMIAR